MQCIGEQSGHDDTLHTVEQSGHIVTATHHSFKAKAAVYSRESEVNTAYFVYSNRKYTARSAQSHSTEKEGEREGERGRERGRKRGREREEERGRARGRERGRERRREKGRERGRERRREKEGRERYSLTLLARFTYISAPHE